MSDWEKEINVIAKKIQGDCQQIMKSFSKVANYFSYYFTGKEKTVKKLPLKKEDLNSKDKNDIDEKRPKKRKAYRKRLKKVNKSLLGRKTSRNPFCKLACRVSPVYCMANGLKTRGYKIRTTFMNYKFELGPFVDLEYTNKRKDELHKRLKALDTTQLENFEMIQEQFNIIRDDIYEHYQPCKMYKDSKLSNSYKKKLINTKISNGNNKEASDNENN